VKVAYNVVAYKAQLDVHENIVFVNINKLIPSASKEYCLKAKAFGHSTPDFLKSSRTWTAAVRSFDNGMSEPGMSPMPIRLQIISDLPQFGNNGLRP
jgi:hypothetical protein